MRDIESRVCRVLESGIKLSCRDKFRVNVVADGQQILLTALHRHETDFAGR